MTWLIVAFVWLFLGGAFFALVWWESRHHAIEETKRRHPSQAGADIVDLAMAAGVYRDDFREWEREVAGR